MMHYKFEGPGFECPLINKYNKNSSTNINIKGKPGKVK